jgi:hypothetical protein
MSHAVAAKLPIAWPAEVNVEEIPTSLKGRAVAIEGAFVFETAEGAIRQGRDEAGRPTRTYVVYREDGAVVAHPEWRFRQTYRAWPPSPPSVFVSFDPVSVVRGAPAVLAWRTSEALAVTMVRLPDGPEKAVGLSGTLEIHPSESVAYRLIARGPGGQTVQEARVEVTGLIAPGPEGTPSAPSAPGASP